MSMLLLSYGNLCFTVTNTESRGFLRPPGGIPDSPPSIPRGGSNGGKADHPPSKPGGDSNGGNPDYPPSSGFPHIPGGSWPADFPHIPGGSRPGSDSMKDFFSGSGSPVSMPMVCMYAKLNRHSDTSGNFVHVMRNVYLGNKRYQQLAHYSQSLCYGT